MSAAAGYVREEQDLIACPKCGSGRLICVPNTQLDGCIDCMTLWYRLPAGEPYLTDGEQLPFHTPCDDCAFRGRSPERKDSAMWADLQVRLGRGGAFYCHKGVPVDLGDPSGQHRFEFPTKAGGPSGYDTERMRLCRGYLNRFIGGCTERVL